MPLSFAFKNAYRSAQLDGALSAGRAFDEAIAKVTGGAYCHVEAWLSGPINSATCYTARQPHGTSIEILDLSDTTLWTVVPVATTPEEEEQVYGYAVGGSGRPYNMIGILGIGTDTGLNVSWDRFCSQECFMLGQKLLASFKQFVSINPLHVAPSGKPPGGYGFFELLTSKN